MTFGDAVPLNIPEAMLRTGKHQCEYLLGRPDTDEEDEEDSWVLEPDLPVPPVQEGGPVLLPGQETVEPKAVETVPPDGRDVPVPEEPDTPVLEKEKVTFTEKHAGDNLGPENVKKARVEKESEKMEKDEEGVDREVKRLATDVPQNIDDTAPRKAQKLKERDSAAQRDHAIYLSVGIKSKDTVMRFARDPRLFMATAARRQVIEVSYKKLEEGDKQRFDAAMSKDIDQFLRAQACRGALRKHVEKQELMKMRWVLTWKTDPDSPDGRKPKARLVLIGYMDKDLGELTTQSPTPSKRARSMLYQAAANYGFDTWLADATAAFLQGDATE